MKKENDFRKQKDLKIIKAFVYEGIYDKRDKNHLNLEILDKTTGKVFKGNIAHYGDKVKK